MTFQHIQKLLFDNYDDTFKIHQLLKDYTGAKSIDILYYDYNKSIFFEKINKIELQMRFLDSSSIIGNVVMSKKPIFIDDINDIDDAIQYNCAIDNPFKLNLQNQAVIPIYNNETIIGIIRLSALPLAFDRMDLRKMIILNDVFIKVFKAYNNIDDEIEHNKELMEKRLENYNIIKELNKLYDKLLNNKANPELYKLIEYGKDNITNIFTYLNPSISKSTKINNELKKLKNNKIPIENRINILIADDIKINVQILNAMLSTYQNINNIKFAYDGLETMDIIYKNDEEKINIIFLDHHMPGKSGTEIAKIIKDNNLENIIIVSITNDLEILEQNKHLYDYHIPKPFKKADIKIIMDKIG